MILAREIPHNPLDGATLRRERKAKRGIGALVLAAGLLQLTCISEWINYSKNQMQQMSQFSRQSEVTIHAPPGRVLDWRCVCKAEKSMLHLISFQPFAW